MMMLLQKVKPFLVVLPPRLGRRATPTTPTSAAALVCGSSNNSSSSSSSATRRKLSSSSLSPALHYEWIDQTSSGSSTDHLRNRHKIVFLHGLLGNGRNLRTFARQFCERQGARGILVDLPGHGKSKEAEVVVMGKNRRQSGGQGGGGGVTFDDCVNALQQTLHVAFDHDDDDQDNVVTSESTSNFTLVGHSMGGRVALHYAEAALAAHNNNNNIRPPTPQPQPNRLILLDTVPGQPHASVAHVVKTAERILQQQQQAAFSRQELTKVLQEEPHGLDQGTAQWLASMFDARRGDFSFDVQVAKDLLLEFEREYHPTKTEDDNNNKNKNNSFVDRKERVLMNHPSIQRIDLVRGGQNKGWDVSSVIPHLERMEAWAVSPPQGSTSTFHMHVLPNAGHWVHVDDLNGLLDALHV